MRAFVTELPDVQDDYVLRGEEAFHLLKVKRIQPKERVELIDGRGGRAMCRILKQEKRALVLNIESRTVDLPGPRCGLFLGLPVQASTLTTLLPGLVQVGVTHIYLGESEFSGRRKKYGNMQERWSSIMRQSLKQCGRSWIPQIQHVSFQELIEKQDTTDFGSFHLYHPGGCTWASAVQEMEKSRSILNFIGPEGGFSSREVETARDAGITILGMGTGILKMETAAVCTAFRAIQMIQERAPTLPLQK